MNRNWCHSRVFLRLLTGGIFGFGLLMGDPDLVLAVGVNMAGVPDVITADPFVVDVSLDGAKEGSNYLRLDLYKDGTKNYFGETFNGSVWYGGSDGKQYWGVAVGSDRKASTKVEARVGSPSEQEFSGDGAYKLRVRRYTASGSQASGDEQIPVDVMILLTTPTPSPSVTVMSSTAITPTPTVMVAPSPMPTVNPTPHSSRTPTLPSTTFRAQALVTSAVSSMTPSPSLISKLSNLSLLSTKEAASGGGGAWQVVLSTGTAEVLGSSAADLFPGGSSIMAAESLDKKIPLVISGAGLILVLFGLSSLWWRKPSQTVN